MCTVGKRHSEALGELQMFEAKRAGCKGQGDWSLAVLVTPELSRKSAAEASCTEAEPSIGFASEPRSSLANSRSVLVTSATRAAASSSLAARSPLRISSRGDAGAAQPGVIDIDRSFRDTSRLFETPGGLVRPLT